MVTSCLTEKYYWLADSIMAASNTKNLIFGLVVMYTSLISASNNVLHCNYYGSYVCPENIVVFDCSVSGGVATVWRGSIFNCRGNQIVLRHHNFVHEASGTCNDGDIVAYNSEVTNNSYMYSSRLNVTVTPEMHNGTVECIQDDFNETFVGTCTLIFSTGNINP